MKGFETGLNHPPVEVLKKMCIILDASAEELLFSETREPLNLSGLEISQIETIGFVYRQLKLIKDQGDNNANIRQN